MFPIHRLVEHCFLSSRHIRASSMLGSTAEESYDLQSFPKKIFLNRPKTCGDGRVVRRHVFTEIHKFQS